MSTTKTKNIDSVDLGNLEIMTTLNTGYDSYTTDDLKREVKLRFIGFDELTGDRFEKFIEQIVAGKLRIKVNSPSSPCLKDRPEVHDSESYAEMLDNHNCEFTFHVPELFTPKKRTPGDETRKAADSMLAKGIIDKDAHVKAYDIAAEQDAEYEAQQ